MVLQSVQSHLIAAEIMRRHDLFGGHSPCAIAQAVDQLDHFAVLWPTGDATLLAGSCVDLIEVPVARPVVWHRQPGQRWWVRSSCERLQRRGA